MRTRRVKVAAVSLVLAVIPLVIGESCVPPLPLTLTANVSPSGSGTVAFSPSGGTYNPNTVVQVTATAMTGYVFDHWQGALSGSENPATITMDANKTVTAVFVAAYTLTTDVSPSGAGTISLAPSAATYTSSTSVQATANAISNWHFDHWEGDLTGSISPTTITMSGNKTVTAVFAAGPSAPTITFDSVPPYNSEDLLRGHVSCATPSDYKVAVYINVSGSWWMKPSLAAPLTTIQNNGTWSTKIVTGGNDRLATDIVAFLVPNSYTPPAALGVATLPQELYSNSAASTSATGRDLRTISFSGRTWQVKVAPTPAGPGPNYFSSEVSDVWVDTSGYLHLRIVNRDGKWYCTEVISTDAAQYGTYTVTMGSRVDALDKNVVFGFFSYDTYSPQYTYREIDIEFSRWGDAAAQNAQYVIQPWDVSGNRYRYYMTPSQTDSVHSFDWRTDQVLFNSWDGNGSLLQSWTYTTTASIPPAGGGHTHINLWLLDGLAPSNGQEVEVIVKSAQLTPLSP